MDLVLRTVAIFYFIFVMMRLVGKRELSTLEPFDLILLVIIGDLVQQGVTQDDYSVTGAFIVVSTLGVLTVATSFVGYRFRTLRRALQGEPVVLVQNGEPIERNLRRERITRDDLAESARLQQVQEIEDVRLAVLETNGNISVIPKSG